MTTLNIDKVPLDSKIGAVQNHRHEVSNGLSFAGVSVR